MNEKVESLIKIVKEDSKKALGCTEPVAVAYNTNVLGSYLGGKNLESLDVKLSKNFYKNGKSVKIPNTGSYGMDLAASVGVLTNKVDEAFMVFSNVDERVLKAAKKLVEDKKVKVSYVADAPDVYIEATGKTSEKEVTVITSNSHTHIAKVIENGKIIFENEYKKTQSVSPFDIKKLSFKELRELIENEDAKNFHFTLEGIEVNKKAVDEGLKGAGSNLGKTLMDLKRKGILPDSSLTDARVFTAAAADMRMGGGNCPIITSGGSGNQGIGVILPIAIVAEKENISKDRLAKALFFAHSINRYVKEYSGKLSGICGCAIGAAIGATAGITWMLGGNDNQIAGACSNIYANVTGVICDGAKESCAMKLSTTAEESIVAAYLAINNVISESKVGILGSCIEETIANIGKLSHGAFTKVDDLMLEIIEKN